MVATAGTKPDDVYEQPELKTTMSDATADKPDASTGSPALQTYDYSPDPNTDTTVAGNLDGLLAQDSAYRS